MKSASHYIDLDDQLPALPAPGAATRNEKVYFSPEAFSPSSPSRVRAFAIAAAWIPCGVLIPLLFSIALATRDAQRRKTPLTWGHAAQTLAPVVAVVSVHARSATRYRASSASWCKRFSLHPCARGTSA
nr:hypothetical protein [Candidatus Sigynarchaeum springense]MDO8115889.1 hypothetical protein [Candidatus Sigynarchaeota archaeon]